MSFMQGQMPDGTFRDVALDASGAIKMAPATVGPQPSAGSQSIVPASDADMAKDTTLVALSAVIGKQDDAPQTSAGAIATLMAFLKGCVTYLGTLSSKLDRLPTALGPQAHTGSLSVVPAQSGTSTVSAVTAATASTLLRGATTARKSLTIFNDSTSTMYVLFGSGAASPTNCSVLLFPGDTLFIGPGEYQGALTGIWTAAGGAARITEVT